MRLEILAVSLLALSACTDLNYGGTPNYPAGTNYPSGGAYPSGGYPNQYPQYPNNGYPNNGYPSGGYYPPAQPPPTYDCRYYNNCPGTNYPPPRRDDRNNNGHHNHGNNNNRPPAYTPPPAPIPPPANSGSNISPSCPSGTVFTGRTCKITDNKLKRPGGDGNINPCPKGMWISNGQCVGK